MASEAFESLAFNASEEAEVEGRERGQRLRADFVSEDYFEVVGLKIVAGRALSRGDTTSGDCSCVVSRSVAREMFGGEQAAVGEQIAVNNRPCSIDGVASIPAGPFLTRAGLWLRLESAPSALREQVANPLNSLLYVWARIPPGRHAEHGARRRIEALTARDQASWGGRVKLIPALDYVYPATVRRSILLWQVGAFLGLLAAWVGAANLSSADLQERAHEFAVRFALGAGWPVIASAVLLEGMLAGLAASAVALPGLIVLTNAIRAVEQISAATAIPEVDVIVGAVTVALAVACGACARIPGLLLLGRAVREGRLSTGMAWRSSLQARGGRGVGLALQSAFSSALVVVASVLSLGAAAGDANPRFETAGVLWARVSLSPTLYDRERILQFATRAQEALRSIPGVATVSYARTLPTDWVPAFSGFSIAQRPRYLAARGDPTPAKCAVGPGFLTLLGVRLTSGDDITGREAAKPAVVSQTAARLYWPHESPLGQELTFETTNPGKAIRWAHVVGVFEDYRYVPTGESPLPEVCVPFDERPIPELAFLIKTRGNPKPVVLNAYRVLRNLDPGAFVQGPGELAERVRQNSALPKLTTQMAGLTASLAVSVVVLGILALANQHVSSRTRELAVRRSLGASAARLAILTLTRIVVAVGIGCAVGWPLGETLASSLVTSMGLPSGGLVGRAAAIATLALTCGLSLFQPLWRVLKLQPSVVLRE